MRLVCWRCGFQTEYRSGLYTCGNCGEPLLVDSDFHESLRKEGTLIPRELRIVTLGEGRTPLIRSREGIYLKLEYLNPSGSFKDRGAATAVSEALYRGCKLIIEDSSGNAGISYSAYAGRAGIKVRIYVPYDAPSGKKNLLKALGAEVVEAPTRDEAARLAVSDPEGCYVGHRINPYFLEGMKDLSLELVKELGEVDYVVGPLASGTLLIGLWKGYSELVEAGMVKHAPKLVAVQACGYESLARYYKPYMSVCRSKAQLPDGIRLMNAPRLQHIAEILKETGGLYVVADDELVLPYLRELWREGIVAEPTSAYGYAVARELVRDGSVSGKVVVILTGNGIKHISGGMIL
ncbi:MAG: pyridoxal-phosphate dependent enzyme [Desulfurococcaceae archaeon TW002]